MASLSNQFVVPGSWRPAGLSALLALVAGTAGVAAGLISASGNINLIATLAMLILAGGFAMSRPALLWLVVIGGLVVVGAGQLYFPETRYIRYVLPIAAGVLVLHGILDRLSHPPRPDLRSTNAIWPWAALFIAASIVSLAFNFNGVGNALTGLKTYFQMWPFLLGLILIQWRGTSMDVLPRAMALVVLLQIPFVIHQYFVLVPLRQSLLSSLDGVVPVDIVAGTFGATLFGGGANAVLAAFMMLTVGCAIALWKHGAMKGRWAFLLVLLCMSPLMVNQTKISIVYLPLVFTVVFYKDIIRAPLKFIAGGTLMAVLLAALLTVMALGNENLEDKSWKGLIEFTIERQQTSISERSGQFSELTRVTALTFWAEEHIDQNPLYALIGHGPGASRVQDQGLDLADTLAERRYGGLQIGYTAISAVLWDTGILGLILTLGMFASAFRLADRLSEYYRGRDSFKAGLFEGLKAGIALLVLSLFHKDFYIFHIPYQTLVLLVLGYLVVADRRIAQEGDELPPAAGEATSPIT